MVDVLERQQVNAIDFDDSEGATEWCPMLVTPAIIEKLDELSRRTGRPSDAVLVEAIRLYDQKTKEQ